MSEQQKSNGVAIESRLETIGIFYLVISVVAGVVLIAFTASQSGNMSSYSYFLSGIAIGIALQGIIFWVLLKAGAEIIRLLKKQNGLPYEGEISTVYEEAPQVTCNACGTSVSPDAKYCSSCGAEFVEEEKSTEA